MTTINVNTQILDENLGDDWADNYAAACALAKYTREQWESDLADFAAAGCEINISIDVHRNTSGASRAVDVSCYGGDDAFEVQMAVEKVLTPEQVVWERFCESDAAAEFWN